jgi:hypothetical protein
VKPLRNGFTPSPESRTENFNLVVQVQANPDRVEVIEAEA